MRCSVFLLLSVLLMMLDASVILDSLLDVSSVLKYEYSGMILSAFDDFSLMSLG